VGTRRELRRSRPRGEFNAFVNNDVVDGVWLSGYCVGLRLADFP